MSFHSLMLKSQGVIADVMGNQNPIRDKDGRIKVNLKEMAPIVMEMVFDVNSGTELFYTEKIFRFYDGDMGKFPLHSYIERLGYFEPQSRPQFHAVREQHPAMTNPFAKASTIRVFVKVTDANGNEHLTTDFIINFKVSMINKLYDSNPELKLQKSSSGEKKEAQAENSLPKEHWSFVPKQPLPKRGSRLLDSLIENDLQTRSSTEQPPIDRRSGVIKELGYWLYSTSVGQYWIKFNDERARIGVVKESYLPNPIWMMGVCYKFPVEGSRKKVSLLPRVRSAEDLELKEEKDKEKEEKTERKGSTLSLPKKTRPVKYEILRSSSPGDAFSFRRVNLFNGSIGFHVVTKLQSWLKSEGFAVTWWNEWTLEAEEKKHNGLKKTLLIKFFRFGSSVEPKTILDLTIFANFKKMNLKFSLSSGNETIQGSVASALKVSEKLFEYVESLCHRSEPVFQEGFNVDVVSKPVMTEELSPRPVPHSESLYLDSTPVEGELLTANEIELDDPSEWHAIYATVEDGIFTVREKPPNPSEQSPSSTSPSNQTATPNENAGSNRQPLEGFSIPIKMAAVKVIADLNQFEIHYNGATYHYRASNDGDFQKWNEALSYEAGFTESDVDLATYQKGENQNEEKEDTWNHTDTVDQPNTPTETEESSNDPDQQKVLVEFLQAFQSHFWFSYRKDFPKIEPSNFTSDVGWGCMLRTSQMLLARAFVVALLSSNWRIHLSHTEEELAIYRHILLWFADNNESESYYSIHSMARIGRKFDKNVGEWFGPCTAAYVLWRLSSFHKGCPLAFYVNQNQSVYSELVIEQATEDGNWKPVLLLLPVRLGIDRFNSSYLEPLKKLFSIPQFLGIAGGKPCKSLFFVANQDDELFYLDPHIVNPYVDIGKEKLFPIESYHCDTVRTIQIKKIDPSMLLGFLIKSQADYDDFIQRVRETGSIQKIFTIHDTTPKYVRDLYLEELVFFGISHPTKK